MKLMIVSGILICSSFLIGVCMFIVSKALVISSATVIVRAGGDIWLNFFVTVLFTVCSVVFCTRVALVCLVCLPLFKEEGSSTVSLQLLYEVPLCMSLLGVGMGTMLVNFHMCGIMLVLRAVFNMRTSSRGHMWFRYMMFNLSGPCELLFLLCFIASWT